jgi:hypothetical protein
MVGVIITSSAVRYAARHNSQINMLLHRNACYVRLHAASICRRSVRTCKACSKTHSFDVICSILFAGTISWIITYSIYGSTALCWALDDFSVSWSFFAVGRTPWTGDQPVARPLPTHRTTQTQNKHTQTSMSWVGFEPTIPALERAKVVHALDRTATVIGHYIFSFCKFSILYRATYNNM